MLTVVRNGGSSQSMDVIAGNIRTKPLKKIMQIGIGWVGHAEEQAVSRPAVTLVQIFFIAVSENVWIVAESATIPRAFIQEISFKLKSDYGGIPETSVD